MENLIEETLKRVRKKESTVKLARCLMKKYFRVLDVEPDDYFNSDRNYKRDIETVWDKHVRINVIKPSGWVNLVKNQLFYNNSEDNPEVQILLGNGRFWEELRDATCKPTEGEKDRILTREQIKQVLHHSPSEYNTAFYLIMVSSSIRPGELVQLEPRHIKGRQINIPANVTKKNTARITFMSTEARRAYDAHLRTREERMIRARKFRSIKDKGMSYRVKEEKTIFPYSGHVGNTWNMMLDKAGLGERLNHVSNNDSGKGMRMYVYHLYTLRKYWYTKQMHDPDWNFAYVELMHGHKIPMYNNYGRDTPEDLKKYYDKHMNCILIFETPSKTPGIDELQSRIEELQKEMKESVEQQSTKNEEVMIKLLKEHGVIAT